MLFFNKTNKLEENAQDIDEEWNQPIVLKTELTRLGISAIIILLLSISISICSAFYYLNNISCGV